METSENIKSYYQDYISIYKDETDRLKILSAILPAVRLFLITKIPKYF